MLNLDKRHYETSQHFSFVFTYFACRYEWVYSIGFLPPLQHPYGLRFCFIISKPRKKKKKKNCWEWTPGDLSVLEDTHYLWCMTPARRCCCGSRWLLKFPFNAGPVHNLDSRLSLVETWNPLATRKNRQKGCFIACCGNPPKGQQRGLKLGGNAISSEAGTKKAVSRRDLVQRHRRLAPQRECFGRTIIAKLIDHRCGRSIMEMGEGN